jgi:hypothetical protein
VGDIDLEDERRKQSVMEKQIGSQRRIRRIGNPKLGKSGRPTDSESKALMDEALLEIKQKAAERQVSLIRILVPII